MIPDRCAWVFVAAGAASPGGVFTSRERAEAWIRSRGLSGELTAYPLDEGCLDWATERGLVPGRALARASEPAFVGAFTSSAQDHIHYSAGQPA